MAEIAGSRWRRLSLAKQYGLTSMLVLLAGMLVIGSWLSAKIASGVIDNTAINAALYLNSFVAPELQELTIRESLAPDTITELRRIHVETPLQQSVKSFNVWSLNGEMLYSDTPEMIGKNFGMSPGREEAMSGDVVAAFAKLESAENILERRLGLPLLEIYSPIRARWTNEVIAIAEFYSDATPLVRQLTRARIESWMVTGGVTGTVFLMLFGIVRRGSQTIHRQQRELEAKVSQLGSLLTRNRILDERIRGATSRAVELNERFLRRLGSELHDGPAQLLSYALLRMDEITGNAGVCECSKPLTALQADKSRNLRAALSDALQEIRDLSAGLAVPELSGLDLAQTMERAVRVHRRRTGCDTDLRIESTSGDLTLPHKIGLYRLVQEALNNAYRHGGSVGQRVHARCDGGTVEVAVSDDGPGFDPDTTTAGDSDRLGLSGMRERIESLGGSFYVHSAPGRGTRVGARLPITTPAGAAPANG